MSTSEVVCSGCQTLLRYPTGASVVRCVICSNVTNVAPPPQAQSQNPGSESKSPLLSRSQQMGHYALSFRSFCSYRCLLYFPLSYFFPLPPFLLTFYFMRISCSQTNRSVALNLWWLPYYACISFWCIERKVCRLHDS